MNQAGMNGEGIDPAEDETPGVPVKAEVVRTSEGLVGPAARATGLPTVAPLWATELGEVVEPETLEQFFGIVSLGAKASPGAAEAGGENDDASDDVSIGRDRLRQLGPLIVDDYDLAPDIIRMYTGLRDD
jgi:hypothetical protein